jgi:hypothetical protein
MKSSRSILESNPVPFEVDDGGLTFTVGGWYSGSFSTGFDDFDENQEKDDFVLVEEELGAAAGTDGDGILEEPKPSILEATEALVLEATGLGVTGIGGGTDGGTVGTPKEKLELAAGNGGGIDGTFGELYGALLGNGGGGIDGTGGGALLFDDPNMFNSGVGAGWLGGGGGGGRLGGGGGGNPGTGGTPPSLVNPWVSLNAAAFGS